MNAGVWLVLGLIAVSGNPVLSNVLVAPAMYVVLAGLGLLVSGGRTDYPFARRALVLSACFCAIFMAHAIDFGVISIAGSAHFVVKLLLGGWLIALLGPAFAWRLFDATFWLCASSLLFYAVLLAVGPESFPSLFTPELTGGDHLKSILVFTVHSTDEWWRNSSMLWEPGAFQGIINLALFLVPRHALANPRNALKLSIMVLALITTFSTTGYLVFFLVVLYRLGAAAFGGVVKGALLAAVVAIAALTIAQVDFLGQKILEQFADAQEYEEFKPDRFGALLFDVYYIEKNPVFGNGLPEDTRFADHPQLHGEALGHGNGLSNFVATFGIAGLLVFAGAILSCRLSASIGPRIALFFLMATLAFGEQFLNYPLFLGLPFLMQSNTPSRRGLSRSTLRRHVPTLSTTSVPGQGITP